MTVGDWPRLFGAGALALGLALLGFLVPLALAGQSDALRLRGLPSPSELRQGQILWLLAALIVVAAAVAVGHLLRRLAADDAQAALLLALSWLSVAVSSTRTAFDSDFLVLAVLHAVAVFGVAAAHRFSSRAKAAMAVSIPVGLLVAALQWAALFVE